MSRLDAAPILESLGFVSLVDFEARLNTPPTSVTITWKSAQPQPSDATLDAVTWSPAIALTEQQRRAGRVLGTTSAVRKTADQPFSVTGLANVTDLAFPLAANTSYYFRFFGAYTAAVGTTGLALAVNGPASPTFIRYIGKIFSGAAAIAGGAGAAYDVILGPSASGGATPLPFEIEGSITTGATAGTLTLRAASKVNASAVNLLRGSCGLLSAVA